MLTPLALKRRKLNDATSKLLKPFVSPLRKPKSDPATSKPDLVVTEPSLSQPYLPSIAAHTIRTLPSSNSLVQRSSSLSSKHVHTGFGPTLQSKTSNAVEAAIQKEVRHLELQIRQVQADVDTLQQAKQITESSTDAHLEALAEKWRFASQAMADELFVQVKDRVDQMGGVSAWKESERRKYQPYDDNVRDERMRAKDNDCEYISENVRLSEDEQKHRKNLKRLADQDTMSQVLETKESRSNEETDDTFTMDMMLQSLNIELDVIGYDKDSESWTS